MRDQIIIYAILLAILITLSLYCSPKTGHEIGISY